MTSRLQDYSASPGEKPWVGRAGGLSPAGGSDALETPPLGWHRERGRETSKGQSRSGTVGRGGAGRTGQTQSQDRGKDMGLEVVQQWGGR